MPISEQCPPTKLVLNDSDLGRFCELTGSIAEAIVRNDGIGIDDENNLADAQRPPVFGPGFEPTSTLLIHLLNGEPHSLIFKAFRLVTGAFGLKFGKVPLHHQ